jgi:hypothetical protein
VVNHFFFGCAGGHGGGGKKQCGEHGDEGAFHDLSLLFGY